MTLALPRGPKPSSPVHGFFPCQWGAGLIVYAEERIGMELSQEFQLDLEQATSAIVVHHPEAKYFNVA